MERLGDELRAIRQVCRADHGNKPVVCIARRLPKPELAQLRAGVTDLALRSLLAGISGNDILINVGIALDAAAQMAQMPIERANAR